jgi:IS5 family transposase
MPTQQLYRKKSHQCKRFFLALRRAAFLPPASWRVSSGAFYDALVLKLKEEKVIRGSKLRVDTMVTEANIHYPTDTGLLADGVRVISRTVSKLKKAGAEGRISVLKTIFGLGIFGLDRSLMRGTKGAKIWVGQGIFTHNLWQAARIM